MTLQKKINEAAEKYVEQITPGLFKKLDNAGIAYSDDLLCLLANDSFESGANFMLPMLEAEQALVAELKQIIELQDDGWISEFKAFEKLDVANAKLKIAVDMLEQIQRECAGHDTDASSLATDALCEIERMRG